MAYHSDWYATLKKIGYSAKDAHKLAAYSIDTIKARAKNKSLSLLQGTTKLTRVQKYTIARLFNYTVKQSDRLKGFSNSNLFDTLSTGQLPEPKDIFKSRGIKYLRAITNGFMIDKARIGDRYLYQITYKVYSEDDFYNTKKHLSVISTKKLTYREVVEKALQMLDMYDEVYKMVPDPNSIVIEKAYFMSKMDYKKMYMSRTKKNG